MPRINSIYTLFRILSLDVVLGACACTMFIANYLSVQLPMAIVIALALGVWLIYTGDHLLDAFNTKHEAATLRHRFHQKHFKQLSAIWIMVLGISIIPLVYLPLITLKWGVILTIAVLVYYLSLQWLGVKSGFFKEGAIAFIYALGVFLGPVSLYQQSIGSDLLLLFGFFASAAFINLLLFSFFERNEDNQDGHASMVRIIGVNNTWTLLVMASVIGGIILSMFIYHYPVSMFMIALLVLMLMVLVSILFFKDFYSQNERYRLVGDAIFFIPIIGLLF